MDVDPNRTMEEDVRELLDRIAEVYGRDLWTRQEPLTDLEQAAQQVARHLKPISCPHETVSIDEKFIRTCIDCGAELPF